MAEEEAQEGLQGERCGERCPSCSMQALCEVRGKSEEDVEAEEKHLIGVRETEVPGR